jgi:anti-sigma regulatory factor (Ser/Thr protein kinase)
MNAVVHGGGGTATLFGDVEAGRVQVWVEDAGKGIDLGLLPRATLERGFSSAGTLGQGFWMMIQTCDRLFLLTGPQGTTLVLEQGREAPLPAWA